MFVVIPRLCVNGGRRRHRLFLLLSGGEEFTHYGILQEPCASGLKTETILLYIHTCRKFVKTENVCMRHGFVTVT